MVFSPVFYIVFNSPFLRDDSFGNQSKILCINSFDIINSYWVWTIITSLSRQGQCTTIEDKMKRLQRHQAFEAELDANRSLVQDILNRGAQLQRGPNGEMVFGYWFIRIPNNHNSSLQLLYVSRFPNNARVCLRAGGSWNELVRSSRVPSRKREICWGWW